MAKCKHLKLKRKLIVSGLPVGTHRGYCTQQCKKFVSVTITEDDILEVYPKGRPVF